MAGYGAALPDANTELNSKFLLEIDNIAIMAFEKLTFGDSEWGLITNRTGADDLTKQTASGLKKETTLTIEKHLRVGGAADVNELVQWHQLGSKNKKSGSVVMMDRDGNETLRINFKGAWVSKVGFPELDASQEDQNSVWTFDLSIPEFIVETA